MHELDYKNHEDIKIIVENILLQKVSNDHYPIEILKEIVSEASEVYANMINPDDEPFLTDHQYDALVTLIRTIDPSYKENIGSSVRGGKIKLPFILGSLDQVYDKDDDKNTKTPEEWIADNNLQDEWIIISDKQDGTSGASVHTKEYGLNISYSRGNGYEGADITRHIKKITNYPNVKHDLKVRYEVITPYELFYTMKTLFEDQGKAFYKNPRNYTAGKMNSETADTDFFSIAKVVATSIIDSDMDKDKQYELLENCGFEVTPWIKIKGRDITQKYLKKYLIERKKESVTEIDGIVLDINSSELRNNLEWKSENPPFSVKYKVVMEEDKRVATVTNVIYEPSKDGYLKPRIEINPVDINGVTISYCTGFNAGYIYDNNINIGTKIIITRQGDVIPHCHGIVSASSTPLLPSTEEFGEMQWTETHVDLVLTNKKLNKSVIINEILHASTTLSIPSLKEGSIKKLVDSGYNSFQEIAFAQKEELQEIVGESAGALIYEGVIEKLRDVPISRLADASQTLGRGIGERTCKKIFETIGFYDFIDKKFTREDLINCEDVGEKTADLIITNIDNFIDFIKSIEGICNFELPKKGSLSGKSFCFTGFRNFLLQNEIEKKGGEYQKSLTKSTTYLVCKNKNEKSSKFEKAIKNGTHIIDEKDLQILLDS